MRVTQLTRHKLTTFGAQRDSNHNPVISTHIQVRSPNRRAQPTTSRPKPRVTREVDQRAFGQFVGRALEVAQLKSAVERCLAAQGSLVMVVGEPGSAAAHRRGVCTRACAARRTQPPARAGRSSGRGASSRQAGAPLGRTAPAFVIHLDTSVLVDALTGQRRSAAALRGAIERGERIGLSALVLYEWLRGPRLPEELAAQEALFPARVAVAFGPREATVAAGLYQRTSRSRGREIDLAIAACALAHEAALWTLNSADFTDVPGLRLVT